ncbi:MAG TPA: hypothetical protein VEB64_07860 [Azospirillaceae bacterium]|nr:hypothetical protein [Azospirillaceae bacterium]
MASDTIADGGNSGDGQNGGAEVVGRLSQVSHRTSLMIIDATLRAVPKNDLDFAQAHAEAKALAGRMLRATEDFAAVLAPVT